VFNMMEIKISEAAKTKMTKVQMMTKVKVRKRIRSPRIPNQKAKVNQKEKIKKRNLLLLLLRNQNVKINDLMFKILFSICRF